MHFARRAARRVNLVSPPSAPPAETQQTIRNNLRHLLRECSYLPDSWARTWTRLHVLHRFRDFRDLDDTNTAHQTHGFDKSSPLTSRMDAKLVEARKAISLLKRANDGDPKALHRIMLFAYGRVGRRRHELLNPILPNVHVTDRQRATWLEHAVFAGLSVPASTVAKALAAMASKVPRDKSDAFSSMSTLLRTLGESQLRNEFNVNRHRPRLRRIEPCIPELNSWLRPMPLSRVRNMTRAEYSELLDRLHAPIGRLEFERLRRLAHGLEEEAIPVMRRACSLKRGPLEVLLKNDRLNKVHAFGHRKRSISSQQMRSQYLRILVYCPTVSWDAEKNSWEISWGRFQT